MYIYIYIYKEAASLPAHAWSTHFCSSSNPCPREIDILLPNNQRLLRAKGVEVSPFWASWFPLERCKMTISCVIMVPG